jgi:hypothetical protein
MKQAFGEFQERRSGLVKTALEIEAKNTGDIELNRRMGYFEI